MEIFIAGIDGDNHELIFSLGGVTELATGFVEAAGGFDNFLLIAEASFGVDAYTYTSEFYYDLTTSIFVRFENSFISGISNYAEEGVFFQSDDTFTNLSLVQFNPSLQFETSSGRPLTEQEYIELRDIIEDVQDYLGGVDQPLDSLNFGLSYEHGSDVVVAANVSEIISLGESLSFLNDGSGSFVFAGYNENGVAVTEISDPQENFALKLIGVEKSDFLNAVDIYFPESGPEVLSGVAV